ncbi:MAG: 3-oxoacyl-ACP reductase FabG [Deltaproteobacteria bacterium]|nr:3-oxoacyl-ACP reductase FabG [Deltaproteobacteria bacterium]MBW2306581.1 3-oxoacyl-ACP reductase FabG [Deltaproteobacteria bacterium]
MGHLEGKMALVTGGGRGIGRTTSLLFAREGSNVAVNYSRSRFEAEQTAVEIQKMGRKGSAVCADVSDLEAVQKMVDEVEGELGSINILVNNAGVRDILPFLQISLKEWQLVIETNLTGTFICSQVVARRMVQQGKGGTIVNVASIAGLIAMPNRTAYVSSKHGIVGLTKQMAMELGDHHIRVNAVAPGVVETDMTSDYFGNSEFVSAVKNIYPLSRWAQPEEVANLILFLASDEASFISGVTIPIDGGFAAGKGIISQK